MHFFRAVDVVLDAAAVLALFLAFSMDLLDEFEIAGVEKVPLFGCLRLSLQMIGEFGRPVEVASLPKGLAHR